MLKPRTISRVSEYFFTTPKYEWEIKIAISDFFDGDVPNYVDEADQKDFMEWLVFDFKLKNGKTLMAEFYDKNPFKLSKENNEIYLRLQKNTYSFFNVLDVVRGSKILIQEMGSENKIWVNEVSASFGVEVGSVLIGRVCEVSDGCFEFVSGSLRSMPIKATVDFRKLLNNKDKKLTPKDCRFLRFGDLEQNNFDKNLKESLNKDFSQVEKKLAKLFKKYDLDKLISLDLVKDWVYNSSDPMVAVVMVLELLTTPDDSIDVGKAMDEMMPILNDFCNMCPKKSLGGISSVDKKKEMILAGDEKTELESSVFDIGEWRNPYCEGLDYFKKNDGEKALEFYNKTAEYLLNNKRVFRDVFRLFANKGIAHLMIGDRLEGEYFLKKALELNPQYDFAREQLRRYESGELDDMIRYGFLQKLESVAKDKNHPMNRWNFDDIRKKWSDDKIIKQLNEFGIVTDKESFIKLAKNFSSSDDLAKEHFYPNYKGEKFDEDFMWMAAFYLWERWSPDIFCVDVLSSWIDEASDIEGKKIKKFIPYLDKIEKQFLGFTDKSAKEWQKKSCYYEDVRNLVVFVSGLLATDNLDSETEERAQNLIKSLVGKVNHPAIDAFNLILLKASDDDLFDREYKKLLEKYKYDSRLSLEMFYYAIKEENEEEVYLLNALKAVENRDKDKVFELKDRDETIFEDYVEILEELAEFYEDNGDTVKIKELQEKSKEIEKRIDELNYSEKRERTEKKWEEMNESLLKEDVGYKYYEFLKETKINFDYPVTAGIISAVSSRGKIGRNDPCPCGAKKEDGSAKKYKKCCGSE